MNEHTPGPWIIDDGMQRQEDLIAALNMDLNNPDRQWCAIGIADVDGFAESVAYCHPANACLIAAAPELLDALCAALPFVEDSLDSPDFKKGCVHNRITMIRTAIAKATSQE